MEKTPNTVVRILTACKHGTTESVSVTIKLGMPYWVQEGIEAACPLTLEGLYGHQPDIRGIDPLDALKNTILLTEKLLTGSLEQYDLYWPDGELYD